MKKFTAVIKCSARLLSVGRKDIDDIVERDRVDVYICAIQLFDFPIESVDVRYIEQVRTDIAQVKSV